MRERAAEGLAAMAANIQDQAALQRAIVELYDDADRRAALGAAARARAANYSVSHMVEAYLAVYRGVLGDGLNSGS